MIYRYGLEDGLKGIEAKYEFKNDMLFIDVAGSNSWQDYALNFLAWPRKKHNGCRYHRVWLNDAIKLADHLKKHTEEPMDKAYAVGHSMGGAVAAILPALMPDTEFKVSTSNAPKIGNKKAVKWLDENADMIAHYDGGDVVRLLPLFYRGYVKRFKFACTKPFWKAHNNFPSWWGHFFS